MQANGQTDPKDKKMKLLNIFKRLQKSINLRIWTRNYQVQYNLKLILTNVYLKSRLPHNLKISANLSIFYPNLYKT